MQMKTWGSLLLSALLQWEVPTSDWTSWIALDWREVVNDWEAECAQDSLVSELMKSIDESSKGRHLLVKEEEGMFISCLLVF